MYISSTASIVTESTSGNIITSLAIPFVSVRSTSTPSSANNENGIIVHQNFISLLFSLI